MKKSLTLTASILAAAMSSQSFGFAYDTTEKLGTREFNYHAWSAKYADPSIPGTPAVAAQGAGFETEAVFQLSNNQYVGPAVPGADDFPRAVGVTQHIASAPGLAEVPGRVPNSTGADVTDATGDYLVLGTFGPECADGEPCGRSDELGSITNITAFNLIHDAEGKIIDGYVVGDTYLPPPFDLTILGNITFQDGKGHIFCSFAGGTSGVNFTELGITASLPISAIDTDPFGACEDQIPATGSTLVFQDVVKIDYATKECGLNDSCAGAGKAVPMPAFAAATLGLGLLGVTALTGRKRKVK